MTLTLQLPSFVYIQTAYADDGGGGAGDSGGGDSAGVYDILTPTETVFHHNRRYTAKDMSKAVADRDDDQKNVVFRGDGRGYENEILNLATVSLGLAAELLNRWRKLKWGDFKGKISVVKDIAKRLGKAVKTAEKIAILRGLTLPTAPMIALESGFDQLDAITAKIEALIEEKRKIHLQSDRRLKTDVTHLATLASGIRLYAFRYLWEETLRVGVMAQDLLAHETTREAVVMTRGGFYAVDYAKLGLKMTTFKAWQEQGQDAVVLTPLTIDVRVVPVAVAN